MTKALQDINCLDKSMKPAIQKVLFFGRHQTFQLRTGWLKKGYVAVADNPYFFNEPFANEELGVGKNMADSIRYWCVAMNILDVRIDNGRSAYYQTDFSKYLFQVDPYIEDPASNWLLHYHLVTSMEKAPVWYFAFNNLSLKEFNKTSFISAIKLHLKKHPDIKHVSDRTLESDYLTFIRTYCERLSKKDIQQEDILDSPFASLELISSFEDRTNFRFRIGPKNDLPAPIVAYAVYHLLLRNNESRRDQKVAQQINFDRLLWDEESPGMCFKLDGESLVRYIEEICTNDYLGTAEYSTTAGMKQLFIRDLNFIDPNNILDNYYSKGI